MSQHYQRCVICDDSDGYHHPQHRPLALEPLTAGDWLDVLAAQRVFLAAIHAVVTRARLRKILAENTDRENRVSQNIRAALARGGDGALAKEDRG